MTKKAEFVDELPALGKRQRGKYVWFAEELRSNPDRWAKFPESYETKPRQAAYTRAHLIRSGKLLGFGPAGQFEAEVRNQVVYVRYVGGAA